MKNTILITGVNGKLGRVLCKYYLENDYIVVGLVSNEQSKESMAEFFQDYFLKKKLIIITVDLIKDQAIEKLINYLVTEKITINYLIHAARSITALSVPNNGITSTENFLKEFNLNVISAYQLTMQLAALEHNQLSAVVVISSMYGVVAFNQNLYINPALEAPVQYSVVKAAQIHLAKELAVRLAPNIRVNSIAFGGVKGRAKEDFVEKYGKSCPMQRMLNEEEIIGPIDFLLSDRASSITGHNLIADGGWTAW